jgi:hypothetical protein
MKLRIRGNSVRLRLTQSEVARFGEVGLVEEIVEFGALPEQQMIYALEAAADGENVGAAFENNRLRVSIPRIQAEKWVNSNQMGIEAEQTVNGGKRLRILIEKDFACLDTRPGEDDADAFPHPAGKTC